MDQLKYTVILRRVTTLADVKGYATGAMDRPPFQRHTICGHAHEHAHVRTLAAYHEPSFPRLTFAMSLLCICTHMDMHAQCTHTMHMHEHVHVHLIACQVARKAHHIGCLLPRHHQERQHLFQNDPLPVTHERLEPAALSY